MCGIGRPQLLHVVLLVAYFVCGVHWCDFAACPSGLRLMCGEEYTICRKSVVENEFSTLPRVLG